MLNTTRIKQTIPTIIGALKICAIRLTNKEEINYIMPPIFSVFK